MRWARDNVKPIAISERNAYHRDDVGQNARAIIEAMRSEAARLEAQAQAKIDPSIVAEAARNTQKWTASVAAATQVDLNALLRDDDLVDFLSMKSEEFNSLITSLSTDVMNRIERETLGAIFEGRSNADIAKSLQEIGGIGRNRARLIARDQASKLNGAMNEFRQQQAGIKSYKWLGINDGRERPTHIANNNRIFAWDNPPPTGPPGYEINCRCRALAVIPDDETGAPAEPSPQEFAPDVNYDAALPIIQRVSLTPKNNVFEWTAQQIDTRLGELQKAQAAIDALKAQTAFSEADADKLLATVFGYMPNDDTLADLTGGRVRSLFTKRRTMMFQAINERMDLIARLLGQAKAAKAAGT